MQKKSLNEYLDLVQNCIIDKDYIKCSDILEEAVDNYPDEHKLKLNLGNVRNSLGDYASAEKIYTSLINTSENKLAHNNLSMMYLKQGDIKRSISHSTSALSEDKEYHDAKYNLALALYENKEYKKTIELCAELKHIDEYFNRSCELQYRAYQVSCDWTKYDEIINVLSKNEITVHPFLHISLIMDESSNFVNAKNWSASFDIKNKNHDCKSKGRIRLGFLCGEIRNHPTFFLIKNMFKGIDKKKFELFLFTYNQEQNEINYLKNDFSEIIDLTNLGDSDAMANIKTYDLDIIIDLTTIISHNRINLIDNESASNVISYLAFPGTTANNIYDFIITDKIVTPEHKQEFYSEKFLYMPESYQVNNGYKINSKNNRENYDISEDVFVLGCLNQSFKLDPIFFNLWLNILKKCESAILWLLNDNDEMISNIKSYALNKIDLDRIIFADRVEYSRHLERIGIIDLALDTRVYNGHTTSIEMIQAGVPVVTCMGDHFASRVSASILKRLGLEELIAHNYTDYENKIVSLINDKELYNKIKLEINSKLNESSILKIDKFSRDFSNLLEGLVK